MEVLLSVAIVVILLLIVALTVLYIMLQRLRDSYKHLKEQSDKSREVNAEMIVYLDDRYIEMQKAYKTYKRRKEKEIRSLVKVLRWYADTKKYDYDNGRQAKGILEYHGYSIEE